ncbi:MAG: hypothetical protein GTO54_00940, partial [Nitrososphaeria archaeon]|nr:hypothetical protein [Nitrososphaeria archaeon]
MRNSEGFGVISKGKAAIVGGTGRMGRVLTRLLKSLDYGVTVCSRSESKARGVADSLN